MIRSSLMSKKRVQRVGIASLAFLCHCRAVSQVRFEDGKCFIEGAVATLAEVEKKQAEVANLIASRQPLIVLITVAIVVLASTGYVERLLLLLSLRRAGTPGLADKLRQTMERYRERPVQYFAIVGSTFCLLLVAAGFYVFLDAEKRSNEISLGRLQFCQLALRTAQASDVLDVQRRNLAALTATAAGIKSLVAELPPDEQRKAQQIVDRLSATVGKENKLLADSIERNDDIVRTLETRTEKVEHGLSGVQADLSQVMRLPDAVADLAGQLRQLDQKISAMNAASSLTAAQWMRMEEKLSALGGAVAGVDAKLTAADSATKKIAGRGADRSTASSQPAH